MTRRGLQKKGIMTKPFESVVNIDIEDSTPDWAPCAPSIAPEGAPNALCVVLCLPAMEPFGGQIETPRR